MFQSILRKAFLAAIVTCLIFIVRFIPEIVGKGGSIRKALQDHTTVRINIPAGVSRDQPSNVKITLAGPKGKIQEAKKLIKEITRVYYTPVTHPGYVHEEIDVPAPLYNCIIGARGSEIRHIEGNFKVSVYIPNEHSVTKNVLVVGEPVGVQGAKRYIQKILDQAGRDKEAATLASDAWADSNALADLPQEEWMEQYIHPSKRTLSDVAPGFASVASIHSPAQAAWGSSVITAADGW